jgi:AmmeMemoRadiSam system protein A
MLPRSNPEPAAQLSISEERQLLALARHAIVEAVLHDRVPDLPQLSGGALSEHRGVFVSLHRRGRLRGCVGRTRVSLPLVETVAQCAISAALGDPRFVPVKPEEVDELGIEVSVLSEPRRVTWQAIEGFEIGKYGFLVVRGVQQGLLLPQVARERDWLAKRFVEEVCRKAGLEPGAWRDRETQIFAFTVEAFSEAGLRQGPTANYSIST